MKCEVCDKNFSSKAALSAHIFGKHKITSKERFDRDFKKEGAGVCICGNETPFKNITKGYCEFCSMSCARKYGIRTSPFLPGHLLIGFTEETRRKLSISQSNRLQMNPESVPSRGKAGYYFSKKNNITLYYRSLWERQAFEMLEQMNNVKKFETCKFSVEYEKPTDYKIHRYIPDIKIYYSDGSWQIIEIKPSKFVDNEINKAKFAAAKEQFGNNYAVWTENDLN